MKHIKTERGETKYTVEFTEAELVAITTLLGRTNIDISTPLYESLRNLVDPKWMLVSSHYWKSDNPYMSIASYVGPVM